MTTLSLPLPALTRRRSRTLAEEAVETLTAPIRAGRFKPGDKLPTETEIMQQLGVSRTVVREAISRLQAGGLVETRRGIGTFVAQSAENPLRIPVSAVSTAMDALSLLEVRIALEVEAAMLAAQRRTEEQLEGIRQALDTLIALESDATAEPQHAIDADYAFHRALAQATGNSYFLEFLTHVGRRAIPRSRLSIDSSMHQRYLRKLNQEHRLLFLAIQAQDPMAASEAARNHLLNSKSRLERALEEQSRASDKSAHGKDEATSGNDSANGWAVGRPSS